MALEIASANRIVTKLAIKIVTVVPPIHMLHKNAAKFTPRMKAGA